MTVLNLVKHVQNVAWVFISLYLYHLFMSEKQHSDEQLASRKQDHIELAFKSQITASQLDGRFFYEPMLQGHPCDVNLSKTFLGKSFRYPLWVSSMTGGTEKARHINENLARLCSEFELGMGLGSCRSLLDSDQRFEDFNLRPIIGNDRPFYANLGIAQIEELIHDHALNKITTLVDKLNADGLIIHVNPLQEWAQPEGDRFSQSPLATIQQVIETLNTDIIVKEVGQGMGPKSLFELMKLPLAAIEFGASGGTNFTQLELNRTETDVQFKTPFSHIGHTADEMVAFVNDKINHPDVKCKEMIISGGVKDYLHGYYLNESCAANSIYGQASSFLRHALKSYENLRSFFEAQMEGLAMAHTYLSIKK